jgi:CRISPR system Cascade subunit CasA
MTDNLLVDPVFRVRTEEGVVQTSLPGVLAMLGRDAVLDFPGLRPHQRHPWHAFLCQLAVMALEEAGENEWPDRLSEEEWRACIRGLTPDYPDDAPWRLVVADLARPAFLQPPVPEGSLAGFTGMADANAASPFDLDVLVTSKEHGEKGKSNERPTAEDWVFGLLLLQTFSGFLGQGNYGISRQNGGFAARPGVSLTFASRPGPNWSRDCRVLFDSLGTCRENELFHPENGLRLLWLEPWKGGKDESLPLVKLHPMFIEICRRVRLIPTKDEGYAFRAKGTSGARVGAKENNGVLGDPWIPVNLGAKGEAKAFNVKPRYSVAHQVMFDKRAFEPCLLQCFHPSDPATGATLTFRVFSRTQGGSDGYHERAIPIPPKGHPFLAERRADAAAMANYMTTMAWDARVRVLRPAVLQLLQASRESPEFKQPETTAWAARFTDALDRVIDEAFFPALWDCLEAMGEASFEPHFLRPWSQFLIASVRNEFKRACASLPVSSALAYRAMAKAECLLEGSLRKNLVIKEAA